MRLELERWRLDQFFSSPIINTFLVPIKGYGYWKVKTALFIIVLL